MRKTSFLIGLCALAALFAATAQAQDDPDAIAKIGSVTITLAELDAIASQTDIKTYQALYDARRQALDRVLTRKLVELEAAERGVTPDELITMEVHSKVTTPTAEEIEAIYNQYKAQFGNQTLEQASERIRAALERQRADQATQALIDKLSAKHEVLIALEPPRVDVKIAAHDPIKGAKDAPVTIVEFSDFQ